MKSQLSHVLIACGATLVMGLVGCDNPSVSANPSSAQNKPAVKAEVPGPKNSSKSEPTATKPGRRLDLTFDDVKFDIEKGEEFDDSMLPDKIREMDGRLIRIRGFMGPSFREHGLKKFVLLQRQDCPFGGPDAYLYHNMMIDMEPGKTTSFRLGPVTIEGKFAIRRFLGPDDKHWSVFHILASSAE